MRVLYLGAEALVCHLAVVWQAFCASLHLVLGQGDPSPQRKPGLVEGSSTAC